MILVAVECIHGFHDRVLQVFNGFEVVVVNGGVLQMSPESLDQVEVRRVGGVPDDAQAMCVRFHKRFNGLGVMDRTVVEEQIEMLPIGSMIR